MSRPVLLGVETSCDETSVAVLQAPDDLLGHVILSQDGHRVYGGVVPELAARAHLEALDDVVAGAMKEAGLGPTDLDAVAVTAGPGLIGALLVGVSWAQGAAAGLGRPVVPVHHMEAHLFAPSLEDPRAEPPFVALLVSGGHTLLLHAPAWGHYELLGETRDDAVGEAFDKVARILDLPYPGGPQVEREAARGDPARYRFPRPMLERKGAPDAQGAFDFSFSGLKTAVALEVERARAEGGLEDARPDLAAGFQAAAVEVLATKTLRAVELLGCNRVLLGGGVAANGPLREALRAGLPPEGELMVPSIRLAVDNGAMVARAGAFRLERGDVAHGELAARADLPFPGLVRRGGRTAGPSTGVPL